MNALDSKLPPRVLRMSALRASLLVGSLLSGPLAACSAGGDNGATGTTSGSASGGGEDAGSGGASPTGAGGDAATSGSITSGPATTGAGGFDECAGTSSTATSEKQPADIIVVVDTSGSMSEEAAQVQDNLNNFANLILESDIDVHVVLIADATVCIPADLGSGQCEGMDTNLPIYQHVVQTVASTDALSLILSTYPQWKDSLRPGATKNFVVVSDDNSEISASEFTSQLLALDPPTFEGFKFMAIVAYSDPMDCFGFSCPVGNPCCHEVGGFACESYADEEGTVYHELIGQTQGIGGDLCTQQFDPIFATLAEGVVVGSQLSCEYPIPPPEEGELDPALVNVAYTNGAGVETPIYNVPGGAAACGPEGGWYYDDPVNPTTIIMCPATCTILQQDFSGRVDVEFGCETVTGPPN